MALRARLVAPPPPPRDSWPHHTVGCVSISAAALSTGQRRLDAETYLATGFGIRLALEGRRDGWVKFGELAELWCPPRIKQVFVDPQHGVPYLNTSQVFDVRPRPRKFLAADKTSKAESRLAKQGTLLVMASASPGNSTVVTKAHENAFISHHFMRVIPRDAALAGWVYGYLRSNQGLAMMRGSQYASIIRHIEPHHVAALPVPDVSPDIAAGFGDRLRQILHLRNRSLDLSEEADSRYAKALGPLAPTGGETGFVVRASELALGRRRLDAASRTPDGSAIRRLFKRSERLGDVCHRVWMANRLKRYYGEGGLPYLTADDVFTVNPQDTKRILVDHGGDHSEFFVKRGWIVMARSGQVYGLIGSAALMTDHHAKWFLSDDLIRIIVNTEKIRPGYLLVALTHRTHGRPLLMQSAYGTSIPHLDPADVAEFPVARLNGETEDAIADLAEEAAKARADADHIEREMAADATAIIDRFIAGQRV